MFAAKVVTLANCDIENQFLLRMFVIRLNKEFGCKVQDLEPKTLLGAIDLALIHEKSSNTNKLR